MRRLVLLAAQPVVLVQQFLVFLVQGEAFLLQLLGLEEFGVQVAFELGLLLLHGRQLVGGTPHLGTQGIHFAFEFGDGLEGEFQFQFPLLVRFGLQ